MRQLVFISLLLSFVILPVGVPSAKPQRAHSDQAKLDAEGNIYVSSDGGRLIKMADGGHCIVVMGALDQQTIGCQVSELSSASPEAALWSHRLEIYRRGGKTTALQTGEFIREWHFWNDGQQVEVYWDSRDAPGIHVLYDVATGRPIEKVADPPEASLLPQWAKDQAQLEDESVPMSAALTRERTMWIAKVLRQIQTIRPGMKRADLLKVFTTEGGFSFRFEQRFVHRECSYIKVDVRFRDTGADADNWREKPGDVIESISKPYLAWGIAD